MRYGTPYMGSKNQIAEWVVDVLPPAENLYDLFAGGCAITHAAMTKKKYQNFVVNDIGDAPKLFCDAVNGKYQNEQRWISREDFFRLKDTDLYVKQCWSFGNDGRSYLYSKEIEPYKKALHYARVFGDYSLLKEMGINGDGSRRDIGVHKDEYKSRYIKWWLGQQGYTTESLENLIAKCKNDTKQIPQDCNEVYGLHQLWQVWKVCKAIIKMSQLRITALCIAIYHIKAQEIMGRHLTMNVFTFGAKNRRSQYLYLNMICQRTGLPVSQKSRKEAC